MLEIWAPKWLFGPRFLVRRFLAELPESLAGEIVVLRCDDVVFSTEAAADEVVRQILVERGAEELFVVGGGAKVGTDLFFAAGDYRVHRRIGRVGDARTLTSFLGIPSDYDYRAGRPGGLRTVRRTP